MHSRHSRSDGLGIPGEAVNEKCPANRHPVIVPWHTGFRIQESGLPTIRPLEFTIGKH
jgi:hypothetical protein